MPTSATGNKLASDAGVTLVEALTALMIVGLMAGAVMLLAPGPDRKVREQAERLAARAMLANEESVILNRTLSLVVTAEGYGFERLEANGWLPAEHNSPLGFRVWPNGLDVEIERSGAPRGESRIARFDAIGNATPARIVMSGAGARWQVDIQGNGEVDVTRTD